MIRIESGEKMEIGQRDDSPIISLYERFYSFISNYLDVAKQNKAENTIQGQPVWELLLQKQ